MVNAPTEEISSRKLSELVQAGTLPSYQSDRGRYDAFATDNTGFIVACGSYSNVAYSTNNADSGQECLQDQAELPLQLLIG